MPLDPLTTQEATALLRRYPAFTYAALRILRTTTDPALRDKMRQRLAATIGSTPDIRELLGADSESLAGFYPDTITPHPTTDKAIEQFIDRFGTPDAPLQYTPGESGTESTPDNTLEDTAEDTAEDTPENTIGAEQHNTAPASITDATSSAIDAFLATVPPSPVPLNLRDTDTPAQHTAAPAATTRQAAPPKAPLQTEKRAEEASLTESFARIMIKNGNYRKALEIMTELNLKNSKKNIYFADQIRFLKKLIAITQQ